VPKPHNTALKSEIAEYSAARSLRGQQVGWPHKKKRDSFAKSRAWILNLSFVSDRWLLVSSLIALAFGLLMIYSTTAVIALEKFGDSFYFIKRQGIAAAIGLIAMAIASTLDLNKLRKVGVPLFFLSVLLLVSVFIPGVGMRAGGAQRWIYVGFTNFQPSEVVKLLLVFFFAHFLANHELRLQEFVAGILKPLLCLTVICALLLKQPDFGSSAVIATITLSMMLVAGVRLRYFALGLLVIGIGAATMVLTSSYRVMRVLTFLDPFSDSSGKGYQLIQSLIAVGSGGATGVGLGSSQQKLFFLPAAHTDFIFGVIAEELGLLGCFGVLALFLIILWRGLRLARNYVEDTYRFTLTIGLTLLLVIPGLLNMGVVTGLLPTKGMTLPLLSYGGSSLTVSLVVVGLLLSLARQANRERQV
jgi:cell division protein FtsW